MIIADRNGFICEIEDGTKIPTGNCFYMLQLGDKEEHYYKIGTTKSIERRMYEHLGSERCGNRDILILFVKSCASIQAAERLENQVRQQLIDLDYYHLPNDRFEIPEGVQEIEITIKKKYIVHL